MGPDFLTLGTWRWYGRHPIRTGRLYSFSEAESAPGTWTCRMLRKKIPSDMTGDRSRDLPTSSPVPTVPQAYEFDSITKLFVTQGETSSFNLPFLAVLDNRKIPNADTFLVVEHDLLPQNRTIEF